MFRSIWRISVILLLLVGCQYVLQNVTSEGVKESTSSISKQGVPTEVEFIVGRVVRVIDGDTVSVLDADKTQHRIRLSQIDAPESKQPYSKVSKEALSALIADKEVKVKIAGIDRYQRVLGEIFIGDTNANLYLVEKGLAWAYTDYVTDPRYLKAQEIAEQKKLGLWRDPQPLAPWDYRHQQREQRKK